MKRTDEGRDEGVDEGSCEVIGKGLEMGNVQVRYNLEYGLIISGSFGNVNRGIYMMRAIIACVPLRAFACFYACVCVLLRAYCVPFEKKHARCAGDELGIRGKGKTMRKMGEIWGGERRENELRKWIK